MSVGGERYAAIAAKVVRGELAEQEALDQIIAISEGQLEEFTALGVLELCLVTASAWRRASGKPAADAYAVREQFKKDLADRVYEAELTLDEAALELQMNVAQASIVLGAHCSPIYGLPIREHMCELAGIPVDFMVALARSVEEQKIKRPTHPQGGPGTTPGIAGAQGQPGAPFPYDESPTRPIPKRAT